MKVCGILDSNAFESKTYEGLESRALFPLSAMANSSCLPNMTHVTRRDRKMVMVATRDIMKGQELLICYTGIRYPSVYISNIFIKKIRWGKMTRQKHLLLTKNFLCRCQRCLDPTECGTYISSIKCTQCQGNVIQNIQTAPDQQDLGWFCQDCGVEVEHKKVGIVMHNIRCNMFIVGRGTGSHDWPDTKTCQQEQHGPPGRSIKKVGQAVEPSALHTAGDVHELDSLV